jgi:zinc D-Ala-D-Ala carboxypeptidase
MIDWSKIKHFKKEEFTCNCGCGLNNMSQVFIEVLDGARDLAGVPFKINCGCRCEKHNKIVGGVTDSAHCKGLAVDISARDDSIRFAIVEALLRVEFQRVLIYPTFVHVDMDLSKPNPILKLMK